ncbi:MAG TPA: zinc-binding dehydrogenase [Acidimicrobiales bacterium]|jgi:threonine dehydrogenase-like Zn-dependent dehydrogenase|nr:zinc-binding dehydrogenase [Acidimicrobiales bacterium]HMS89861.1 zinc-binding dehydrogenase [Acidimicrobiales bacterium]HRA35637.1 zinc-binding dehydrogenase [Acidimicrobiales bacterium]
MKALRFHRKPGKYAAAAVAGRLRAGSGASVGPLSLRDVDEPDLPTPEWVRLRPRLAGICGSDLATIDGHSSRYFEPIVSFPFTPGHEVVGDLDDGTRAVLIPVLSCVTRGIDPVCPACAAGRTNHCGRLAFGHLEPGLQSGFCESTGGGWSAEMVAHPSQLLAVPDHLSDEAAVMVEPTACAVHAARRVAAHGPLDTVAVIGTGTLGLLTIAALRHASSGATIGRILATGKYPHQKDLARSLGADQVVAPGELGRVVRSLTGAWVLGDGPEGPATGGEGQLTDGVDLVVDCVGSPASLTQALHVVAPGGEVLVVGMPGHTSLDLTTLWHRETAIRGCYAYTRPDFEAAVSVVADADLGRLVSATYPLSRYTEAIEHAATAGPRGAVKVAFDLRRTSSSTKDRR